MRRLDELPPEVPGELHAEDSRGVALAGAKADLTAVIRLRTCFLWRKLNPRVSWPPSFWVEATCGMRDKASEESEEPKNDSERSEPNNLTESRSPQNQGAE